MMEIHKIGDREVYVQREDLVGGCGGFPPWAKIEGVRKVVRAVVSPEKPLTHLSVYGSWTGWVLSKICKEEGIEFISAFSDSKKFPEIMKEKVLENGSELLPLKPNMMAVLNGTLRNLSKERDWQMLPYAFNHAVYLQHMKDRMLEVTSEMSFDHLVVSMGSGVTASGLANGFLEFNSWEALLTPSHRKVHSVYMSSLKSVGKVLRQNTEGFSDNGGSFFLYPSEFSFDDLMEGYKAPFDCNEFWDLKTWYWLEQNISRLEGRVLFWNLGGSYLKTL